MKYLWCLFPLSEIWIFSWLLSELNIASWYIFPLVVSMFSIFAGTLVFTLNRMDL